MSGVAGYLHAVADWSSRWSSESERLVQHWTGQSTVGPVQGWSRWSTVQSTSMKFHVTVSVVRVGPTTTFATSVYTQTDISAEQNYQSHQI